VGGRGLRPPRDPPHGAARRPHAPHRRRRVPRPPPGQRGRLGRSLPPHFGWRDLSGDPCGAAVEVQQVLVRRGWTGELRRAALLGS
jgi:hypothetical protein